MVGRTRPHAARMSTNGLTNHGLQARRLGLCRLLPLQRRDVMASTVFVGGFWRQTHDVVFIISDGVAACVRLDAIEGAEGIGVKEKKRELAFALAEPQCGPSDVVKRREGSVPPITDCLDQVQRTGLAVEGVASAGSVPKKLGVNVVALQDEVAHNAVERNAKGGTLRCRGLGRNRERVDRGWFLTQKPKFNGAAYQAAPLGDRRGVNPSRRKATSPKEQMMGAQERVEEAIEI